MLTAYIKLNETDTNHTVIARAPGKRVTKEMYSYIKMVSGTQYLKYISLWYSKLQIKHQKHLGFGIFHNRNDVVKAHHYCHCEWHPNIMNQQCLYFTINQPDVFFQKQFSKVLIKFHHRVWVSRWIITEHYVTVHSCLVLPVVVICKGNFHLHGNRRWLGAMCRGSLYSTINPSDLMWYDPIPGRQKA